MFHCKRCKQAVEFSDPSWSTLTDASIDSIIGTLPDAKLMQVQGALNNTTAPTDISRYLSQQFRTEQIKRHTNGTVSTRSTHMEGTMNLVLDSADRQAPDDEESQGSSQADSFILLSSSQLHPMAAAATATAVPLQVPESGKDSDAGSEQNDMAKTFGVIGRIMDRLDGPSAIEHPVCEDCAETMLRLLDREVQDCEREHTILQGIGQLADTAAMADDIRGLERDLVRQSELERTLEETLGMLDSQLEELASQLADLDEESQRLDRLEAQTFQEQNEHQQVLSRSSDEQWALDEKYKKLSGQLMQLQRTNVYNDIFNISVVDNIANINGFRLGGRGSVEWAETNAAWGQALLLLQTVARRLNYEFLDYRLIPMGAFSRIERLADGAAFELFGAGDPYFGRLFQSRKIDSAMVAFLACLDQVAQLIMSLNPQVRVPYRIEQDRIGGVSIKMQFGQDDAWTRACRNTLMDARWALAFASSYSAE